MLRHESLLRIPVQQNNMELAGLVVGSVTLTALFDSVITNVERIRIGRDFDQSHESYILQVEVLKLRLHRWRDAVRTLTEAGGPGLTAVRQANGELAKRHLELIQQLLDKEETLADSYHKSRNSLPTETAQEDPAQSHEDRWLVRTIRFVIRRHRRNGVITIRQDFGTPRLRTRASWAISGEGRFRDLVSQISTHVTDLEHIISTDEMAEELRKMRSEDARELAMQPESNKTDLDLLKKITLAIDQKFAELVPDPDRPAREWVGNIAEDQARIMQGDVVSNEYRGTTFVSLSGSWRENVARGDSKITQGTVYGYNPFA
ncbi:putative heterokaryon incompatibility protein [Naviculisporaceae sp. PSN 640]